MGSDLDLGKVSVKIIAALTFYSTVVDVKVSAIPYKLQLIYPSAVLSKAKIR